VTPAKLSGVCEGTHAGLTGTGRSRAPTIVANLSHVAAPSAVPRPTPAGRMHPARAHPTRIYEVR